MLPAIAADALRRADLPSKLTAWDVVEWALKQEELPPQRDLHGNFADPPITIYSGPRFHIDVYFWFEGTTAIHQHAFCGAFQVLLGSSIHSWYEFERPRGGQYICRDRRDEPEGLRDPRGRCGAGDLGGETLHSLAISS